MSECDRYDNNIELKYSDIDLLSSVISTKIDRNFSLDEENINFIRFGNA